MSINNFDIDLSACNPYGSPVISAKELKFNPKSTVCVSVAIEADALEKQLDMISSYEEDDFSIRFFIYLVIIL